MSDKTNGYLIQILNNARKNVDHSKHGLATKLYDKFRSLETDFFENVHSHVDVGLAIGEMKKVQNKAQDAHIMTVHGCRHVCDLIGSLDKIVQSIDRKTGSDCLEADEAYLLLCAAHLHDAGNIGGRKDHATRSGELIEQYKKLFYGTEARQQVYDVARVHGGSTSKYGKDTFRSLLADNYQRPRLPLLAAILRIGDELSENPERVPTEVLNWFKASPESNLAYRYSESFRGFSLQNEELSVEFRIYPRQHSFSANVNGKSVSFFDYLEDRLDKLDKEARYCSQYGRPALSIRKIVITIRFHEENIPSQVSHTKQLTLDLDHGYPSSLRPFAERCAELNDQESLENYCRGIENE